MICYFKKKILRSQLYQNFNYDKIRQNILLLPLHSFLILFVKWRSFVDFFSSYYEKIIMNTLEPNWILAQKRQEINSLRHNPSLEAVGPDVMKNKYPPVGYYLDPLFSSLMSKINQFYHRFHKFKLAGRRQPCKVGVPHFPTELAHRGILIEQKS